MNICALLYLRLARRPDRQYVFAMRPLISYYGGKQRMASRIVDLLPRHTNYVEPFAGGAAVLFAKPRPPVANPGDYREVLNDTNGDVVNLYRVATDRNDGQELIRRLQRTLYSREQYQEALALLRKPNGDRIDRAWATYVNAQMSFGNKLFGGWGTNLWNANGPASWIKRIVHLQDMLARLAGCYIEHEDALDVIRRWDSPHTLFYCDPPYPGTHQGHYSGYTTAHFDALVRTIETAQGSFVLSCYEQAGVPDRWERFEFRAINTVGGRVGHDHTAAVDTGDRDRTEVVWRLDRSDSARPECIDIWDRWGWQRGTGMGSVRWSRNPGAASYSLDDCW